MPRKHALPWLLLLLLSLNLACQLSGGAASPTQKPPPTATVAASPTLEPSPTTNFAATDQARANAQATQEAVAQADAATQQASDILAQTAKVEMAATEQAGDMFALIQELNGEGYLDRTEGVYYTVENFDESWAQINWYQWWATGLAPTDFVLRAHTEWESASRTANWFSSVCGFVFREEDENNHYIIFLALDGNVYLSGSVEGIYTPMGKDYYGKLDFVEGGADVMLVVEGTRIQYFVNGELVLERDNPTFDHGDLGLTLLSGTNKDFGTRCQITGVEVWDLTE